MSVHSDFKSASKWMKLSFIFLFLASVLSAISFTTTGWASDETAGGTTHYGLWRICDGTNLVQPCSSVDGTATGKSLSQVNTVWLSVPTHVISEYVYLKSKFSYSAVIKCVFILSMYVFFQFATLHSRK